MQVTISGRKVCNNLICWQVDFIPGPEAPDNIRREEYRILVSKESGLAQDIIYLGKSRAFGSPTLLHFDYYTYIAGVPEGFPVQFLPMIAGKEVTATWHNVSLVTGRKVDIKKPHTVTVTSKYVIHDYPVKISHIDTVTQKWVAGASWWSEYELSVDGERELHATLVPKK